MLFVDCETVGLTGPPVLIQWAQDDGPVHLHDVWADTDATVDLIRFFTGHDVCAWNLKFDWFHMQRLFCVLKGGSTWDRVDPDDPCVKPKGALDLYLHMLKGSLAPLKGRAVRLRDIPAAAADELVEQLQRETDATFPAILGTRWKVQKPKSGREGFVDVNCHHKASLGLKYVARHLLGVETIDMPVEQPSKDDEWDFQDVAKWSGLFETHKRHWRENAQARAYAEQDIVLLRRLWELEGRPEAGDYDSELAVAVACCRYRGFAINEPAMKEEIARLETVESAVKHDHHAVARYLKTVVPDVVEVRATRDEVLHNYEPFAPEYIAQVRAARSAKKSLDILKKAVKHGRVHMDFRVIGTLTGRMSGMYHGVPKKGTERFLFTMANEDEALSGGDFDGYEVAISAALFDDPELTKKLQEGKKFHALYGADVYGDSYDEIIENKDRYGRAKGAVFATFYGAQAPKIADVLGVSLEEAIDGRERLFDSYPGIRREQEFVEENYNTMKQSPQGQVFWREPLEFVESMFGYKRDFRTEILLARTLYKMAENLKIRVEGTVERRKHKGKQSLNGACRSAMYGAAFSLLGSIARVAGNHRIQATGAQMTKVLEERIWRLQPAGIQPWRVMVFQFHDELLAVHRSDETRLVKDTVEDFLTEYRESVPMLSLGWNTGISNWGER